MHQRPRSAFDKSVKLAVEAQEATIVLRHHGQGWIVKDHGAYPVSTSSVKDLCEDVEAVLDSMLGIPTSGRQAFC